MNSNCIILLGVQISFKAFLIKFNIYLETKTHLIIKIISVIIYNL